MATGKKILTKRNVFVFLFLVIMYVISFNIPLVADDFSYSLSRLTGERLNNVYDVFVSVGHEYLTWNGRLLGYFFTQLFLIDSNQLLFRIVYPIVNLIIIFELVNLADSKKIINYFLATALLFSMHILVLNQTMFWIIGWAIYVLPLVFILPIINYFKKICKKQVVCDNKVKMFLFALISSLFVEHYSLIIICLSIVILICEYAQKSNSKNSKQRINKTSLYLLLGAAIGNMIIFLAPGILDRMSTDLSLTMTFAQKIHFGYSRFIYCFFYMNQRIFLLLAIVIIFRIYQTNIKRTPKTILIIMLVPVVLFSTILIFKPTLLNPYMLECLTGEWSYYTCELSVLLKYSVIVMYYIVVFLLSVIVLSKLEKDIFQFIVYGIALMSSLVFVATNMACERTQFISGVMLIVLFLENYNQLKINLSIERILCSGVIVVLTLLSYKFVKNYINQFNIYKLNEEIMVTCSEDSDCEEVEIYEHDYRYVFKSDLNFDEQDGWVLNSIRKYYNLKKDVLIKPR